MRTDYNRMLAEHAARWTLAFVMLVPFWVVSVMVSLLAGNVVPALAVSALLCGTIAACRVRYRQLLHLQQDEELVQMLRDSLKDQ